MKIGRTSENDLVLHDHGVSRRHARIVERKGQYFAEDLGSSNGTALNGTTLPGEQLLRDGDRIGVGPVEFTFVWVPPDGDEDATRPIRRNAPVVAPGETTEPGLIEAAATAHRPAYVPAPARPGAPAALARPEPAAAAVARPEPATVQKAAPAEAGMSAADRARRRREMTDTRSGQFALWWSGLPRARRMSVALLTAMVLVGGVGTLVYVFAPETLNRGNTGPEPKVLGFESVADSFGLGEGVTWERPDAKEFEFQFVTPTRAVAVLRYQASNISKEEVSLILNGVDMGWVPADTATTAERDIELILPPTALRRNELNHLTFDNVRNPPGNETWRVWNIRLEVVPVPELPTEELLARARQYVAAGARYSETRAIGSDNLFKAWQQYRFAWITLEALDEKPELYQDVRYTLGQIAAELDHKCSQLMLDFQKAVQFRSKKKALAALEEVKRRFPTTEHRCHNLALEKAYGLGLE